jgi:hypothetical protein
MDVSGLVSELRKRRSEIQETGESQQKDLSFVLRYLEQSIASKRETSDCKKHYNDDDNYNNSANYNSANHNFLSKTSHHSDYN